MNQASGNAIISAVHELIEPPALTELVKAAVVFGRSHAQVEPWPYFAAVIDGSMRVDGFVHVAAAAPMPILAPRIARRVARDPNLYATLLHLWAPSQEGLREKVETALVGDGVKLGFHNIPDDLTASEVLETVRDLATKVPRDSEDIGDLDVQTMVFSLLYVDGVADVFDPLVEEPELGQVPDEESRSTGSNAASEENEDGVEQPRSHSVADVERGDSADCYAEVGIPDAIRGTRFEDWALELAGLPATSGDWDAAKAFAEFAAQMAVAKVQEALSEAAVGEARDALESLVAEAADTLRFLGLEQPEIWLEGSISVTSAPQLMAAIEVLSQALDTYGQARSRLATASSRREEQELRREVDGGADDALGAAASVSALLGTEPSVGAQDVGPSERFDSLPDVSGGTRHDVDDSDDPEVAQDGVSPIEPEIPPAALDPEAAEGEEVSPIEPDTPSVAIADVDSLVIRGEGPTEASLDEGSKDDRDAGPAVFEPTVVLDEAEREELEESLCLPVTIPAEAAQDYMGIPSESTMAQLICSLVAAGDIPAGYWLARAQEEKGECTPVPSWLLASAQGAQWLTAESELVSSMRAIVEGHQLDGKGLDGLYGLASSLRPVLVEPQSGLLGWLQTCGEVANAYGLQDLVSAVLEFGEQSFIGLRPEDLDPVRGAALRSAELTDASEQAGEWLNRARDLKPKYHKAVAVWHAMVGTKGSLRAILEPVIKNDVAQLEQVREDVQRWSDETYIRSQVREVQLSLNKTKAPVIEASTAEWFVRRVHETCEFARRWCQLAEREQELAVRGDWLFRQVDALRSAVGAALPTAEEILVQTCSAEDDTRTVAATKCLLRALEELRVLLDLQEAPQDVREAAACDAGWPGRSWWTQNSGSLEQSLGRRLLWVDGSSLDDLTVPKGPLEKLIPDLAHSIAEGRTLEEVVQDRFVGLQDFRFAETLVVSALPDGTDVAAFLERFHSAIDESRAALDDVLRRTSQLVEQSVIDGAIDETERAQYAAELEALGRWPREATDGLDVGSRLVALNLIEDVLEDKRKVRVKEQAKDWKQLRPLLEKRYKTSDARPVLAFVDERIKTGDLVVAGECIAALQAAYDDKSQALSLGDFMAPARESVHETYKSRAAAITKWAAEHGLSPVIREIAGRKKDLPLDLTGLNKPRLEEVVRSLQEWQKLKTAPGSRNQAKESIPAILRYLGFDLVFRDGGPVEIKDAKGDWLHAIAGASAGLLARPIPQFGSMANERYDVVCIWERPNVGSLGERLDSLGLSGRPVLVFYLGHLYEDQKRDLVTASRRRSLSAAVLDESLLLYLATSSDDRLPDFLACALPYATLNPYTPSVAGNVPQEIYYGRRDLAEQLQSQQGTCLVYGGRQLGKSALLRHVERQFHDPSSERYCAVEDIKHIGDPESDRPAEHIWKRLHRVLLDLHLISGRYASRGDLARKIVAMLEKVPDRRVIVMFDEADHFLDDDSRDGFSQVNALKVVMERTSRRFKVVFAGLHQVQRFQSLPNQPLAHLGRPILVGPLEPIPARKLVRGPMEMLGYDMDNAAVLRILSYTNYHPGLIQLFCHELVKHLNRDARTKLPPYSVDQATIESVYYKDVRDGIRERFDWTLALDPYYQVIAWSIILDQLESRDGFSRTYSLAEVMRTVKDWWTAGFESIARDELRSLLTEMCGLGVLVESRNDDGVTYRLRSPNLVRLMGTEDDVVARLSELESKLPREADVDRRSYHRWVEEAGRYSPLTISQEQQANLPRFGVSIVFGSEALGLNGLEDAARTLLSADASTRDFQTEVVSKSAGDAEAVQRWLKRYLERNTTCVGLVAYLELGDRRARVIETLVDGCVRFCEANRAAKKGPWLRIILSLGASATWEWLSLPGSSRLELESRADAAMSLRPLDLNGMRQWLRNNEMMATEPVCETILGATAGWPLLVDEVKKRAAGNPDARPAAADLAAEIAGKPDQRSLVRSAAGLDVAPVLVPILHEVQGLLPAGEEELLAVAPAVVDVQPDQVTAAIEFARRMGYLVEDPKSMELALPRLVSAVLDP